MPKAQLRISDEFIYDLAAITSLRVLSEIQDAIRLLADMPEMGSPQVRESLVRAFGANLRKIPIASFVIIYRYEAGVVDVLACVYGARIC